MSNKRTVHVEDLAELRQMLDALQDDESVRVIPLYPTAEEVAAAEPQPTVAGLTVRIRLSLLPRLAAEGTKAQWRGAVARDSPEPSTICWDQEIKALT